MTIVSTKIRKAPFPHPPFVVYCSAHIIRVHRGKLPKPKLTTGGRYCVSCFSQFIQPDQEFIDFSVDWDGGTLNKNGELQTIDDLVLCKNCVEQAAKVLGMDYPEELEAKNKELDTEVRSLRAKIAFLKKDLEK